MKKKWSEGEINFLLENKILSKNKTNEEVCIQVNSILDLLNNKLIDRKDLMDWRLDAKNNLENLKLIFSLFEIDDKKK